MNTRKVWLTSTIFLIGAALTLLMGGCSSTSGGGNADRDMRISPDAVDLMATDLAEFTAFVAQAEGSESFRWKAECGDVSPTGVTVWYKAPSTATLCEVTATLSGTSVTATADAMVRPLEGGTVHVSVTDGLTTDPVVSTVVLRRDGVEFVRSVTSALDVELPPGEYSLTISDVEGYETFEPRRVRVAADTERRVDAQLVDQDANVGVLHVAFLHRDTERPVEMNIAIMEREGFFDGEAVYEGRESSLRQELAPGRYVLLYQVPNQEAVFTLDIVVERGKTLQRTVFSSNDVERAELP